MMMNWEIRADGVLHIDGYVNAVERDSREIFTKEGKCVERVLPGVFGKALAVADEVRMLLNHKADRQLASTKDTLTLTEDNIGLRATADITDEEVIEKARLGKLRGWSFGFRANKTEIEKRSEGVPRRILKDINLYEVSIIDDEHNPCYNSTSLNYEFRCDDMEIRTEDKVIDSYVDKWYNEYYLPRYYRFLEVRYNPYHDPSNGRFTSGASSGGGGDYLMVVPQGRKGRGVLVKDVGLNSKDEAKSYYDAVYHNSTINNGKHRLVNGNGNLNSTEAADLSSGKKFGVSGGAGTAYTLVQTAEGNKLVRNDYLTEVNGQLIITAHSTSTPRMPVNYVSPSEIAKSAHSANPDSIAGVKQGNPMTFAEANSGNVNPKYGATRNAGINCQTCVPVFVARLKGYDIEAKTRGSNGENYMKTLSYDTTLAYIDPNTGRPPALTSVPKSSAGETLNTTIKSGEIYAVQFDRSSGSGHIITASRDARDNIQLYDPQPSRTTTGSSDINKYFVDQRASKIEIYRVDNLEFNEDVMNNISKAK